MRRTYSRRDKELMETAQLGMCGGCLKPLGDSFDGHAVFPGNHSNMFTGVALHPECHQKTKSYGTGGKGLLNYFGVHEVRYF